MASRPRRAAPTSAGRTPTGLVVHARRCRARSRRAASRRSSSPARAADPVGTPSRCPCRAGRSRRSRRWRTAPALVDQHRCRRPPAQQQRPHGAAVVVARQPVAAAQAARRAHRSCSARRRIANPAPRARRAASPAPSAAGARRQGHHEHAQNHEFTQRYPPRPTSVCCGYSPIKPTLGGRGGRGGWWGRGRRGRSGCGGRSSPRPPRPRSCGRLPGEEVTLGPSISMIRRRPGQLKSASSPAM